VKVTVRITNNFKSEAKPLLKKYKSLTNDLLKLEKELFENPWLGTPLGQDAYKIRLKISSKNKGKSGGARVISLVDSMLIGFTEQASTEEVIVNLLSIYDKSDVANITDKELKDLIKSVKEGSK
jgi:mRNA-degrading endonuclease RelE of RelBE toxin-antitoxin system